jgi:class I fructose-bisphosphate aldolase
MSPNLHDLLGDEADSLLGHSAKAFPSEGLVLPGPDYLSRVFSDSDRSPSVLRNLGTLYNHGRLGGTGYLSILPVDQGIEHSACGQLRQESRLLRSGQPVGAGAGGRVQRRGHDLGTLGMVSRRYVHRIPFIVKLNHNQFLHVPNTYDQIMFARCARPPTWGPSAWAPPSTSAPTTDRELQEVSAAFAEAHRLGLFTVLWCYLRNSAFQKDGVNYELSADLTGQANHLGVTIEADIIKQKQPENNGGYNVIGFGRTDPLVYDELTTDHPIDLTRWQVVNCYAGRIGLINSGGESKGDSDLAQAVRTAVINKRAGGTGLIVGRKAFQRPTGRGCRPDPRRSGRLFEPRGHHRLTPHRAPGGGPGAGDMDVAAPSPPCRDPADREPFRWPWPGASAPGG